MPTVLSILGVYSPVAISVECHTVARFHFANNNVASKSILWNNRIGHPSSSRLQLLSSATPDVIFCNNNFPVRTVCPLAK